MKQIVIFLCVSLVIFPLSTGATAQCSSIVQQTCSCPGSPPVQITICSGPGNIAPYGLYASCCGRGRLTPTCYDGGYCPFAKLLNKSNTQLQLATLAQQHLVLVPDCKGALHPIWRPQADIPEAAPLDLSIHPKLSLQ